MKVSLLILGAFAFAAVIPCSSCSSADTIARVSTQQVVPASEIKDVISAQFAIDGRQLTVTMRSDAAIPAPTGAAIHFPPEMFNGFTDGGIKSFLGVAGLYTESAQQGAPLFWTSATQAALPDLELVTRLVLNNPNGESNQIQAQFFDQDGTPLNVRVDGETASQVVFTVPGQSSLQPLIESVGGETSVGWMMLTSQSDLTFRSAVVFSSNTPSAGGSSSEPVSGARLKTEAGISSSELDTRHVLRVAVTQDGLNTAFAIANPTDTEAHIRLLLKPDSGDELTADPLTLAAHNQTARFVTDLFDLPSGSSLEGRLLVLSDTDLGVTSLETLNGGPSASLPSGTTGEQ
ncbi:MAG: hypothetical protein P8Y94_06490 [Acidobacteriota bacterium]